MARVWVGFIMTAIILRGQIRRDLWTRRACTNILARTFILIIMLVISRGLATNCAAWCH